MNKTKKVSRYSDMLEKLSKQRSFKISARDLDKERKSVEEFDEAMCRQLSISQKTLEMEVSI
ncbi:MAG: hypothetical protein Q8O60_00415 [Deltaproteobacteria bacterium]|nr:hypothetical protein [Deltaproteobacteria bacterium]MDP3029888.1 hypothetical protein [Deltaproteobacteria bacterium]